MSMSNLGVLLLFVISACGPTHAQDAEPVPDDTAVIPVEPEIEPEAPPPDVPVFEDIVVTATKREESVREIAGTVFALTGDQLEEMSAREQEDFLRLVPGVSLFKGEPNQNRIGIRGIAEDYGTAQSTGILIADVPFSDPFVADLSPDLSPFDLQSVEVLKGPQGTLFGASGLGGALRYVPRPAQLGDREVRGFLAYDGVTEGQTLPTGGLSVNTPLFREDLALRIVGTQRRRPGVIDETGRGERDVDASEQTSYRGLLRFAPTERLDAQFLHLAQDTSIADLGFVDDVDDGLTRDSTPTPSPTVSDFSLDALTLSYAFDGVRLVSATGRISKLYETSSDTSRLVPATRVDGRATVEGYTQEVRLVSDPDAGGPWRWLAGAFLMRYDTFRRVDLEGDTLGMTGTPVPSIPFVPGTVGATGDDTGLIARYDLDATAGEESLFGEVTRTLGAQWDVTLGLRAYRTAGDGIATASGPLNVVLTGEQEARNDAGIREQGLNPKAAVRFRPVPDLLLYALAARGFRFGGVSLIGDTQTDDVPETYDSDRIWLYEIGARSTWLARELLADASVYRIDWYEPQITQITDSGLLTYTDNAGGARVLGAELALRYLTPVEGLSLSAAAGYTDARTTEAFMAASGTEVAEGARWPFTPRTQFVTAANYDATLGRWNLSLSAIHTQTGEGVGNIENTIPIYDYDTVDVRLLAGMTGVALAPTLTISGTNLFDERGIASRSDSGDVRTIYYVRPRTFSLQLALAF